MAARLSRVTTEGQTKQFATRAAVISDNYPSGITNAVINSTAWDVLNDPEGLKIIIAHVHSKYGRDRLFSLSSALLSNLNCHRMLEGAAKRTYVSAHTTNI